MLRIFGAVAFLALATAGPLSVQQATTKAGEYMLSGNHIPENYIVYLVPFLEDEGDRNFTFDGEVTIKFKVKAPTDTITLHINELVIDEAYTKVSENPDLSGDIAGNKQHTYEPTYHFLHIKLLGQTLAVDKTYYIYTKFTGMLNKDMDGFYRSSYNQDGEIKWMATTQFESTGARRAFPCFDEPRFKATFDIHMSRKPAYHVLANMPLKMTTDDPNVPGRQLDTFETSVVMSTYLVAFIVSDFHSITYTGHPRGLPISVWARKNSIRQGAYALEISPQALQSLDEFTGIPYDLPKLDNVALADFAAGAMENWALVTYRETSLLFDPIESTENNKQRVATVIAHEFAHLWFGDLVTLEWWSYTWLNEGFARYLQYVATDVFLPEWDLLHQMVVDQIQPIFRTDSLKTSPPLTKECETPAEINAMFGSISYTKGAAILRMFDHVLTRKVFSEAIHNYLVDNSYGSVTPDHLFTALNDAAPAGTLPPGVTIADIADNWTTKSGYPVITVTRNHDSMDKIVISQAQFLLDESSTDTLWWVPLSWTKKSDVGNKAFESTTAQAWLQGVKTATFDIPTGHDEWIIFNNQLTGYYRVAYDSEVAWPLVVEALGSSKFTDIHVLNRAQIIDDALNLARGGVVKYDDALESTLYLKNEVAHIPWVAAFNSFSYLESRLISGDGFDAFKKYVLQSLDKLYNHVSFTETPQEPQTKIFSRISALSWACKYGHVDCIDNSKKEFKLLVDAGTMVSSNKKSVVYCTALREGTAKDWDFMWTKYLTTDLAQEQVLILSALGCTKDSKLLNDYLMKSITENSGIRNQDALSVFTAVYNNPLGVDIAFDFMINNFAEMKLFYLGGSTINNAITGIGAKLTTRAQVDKLILFVADNIDDPSVAITGPKAVEAAEADLVWFEKNGATILNWMKTKTSGATDLKVNAVFCMTVALLSLVFKAAF